MKTRIIWTKIWDDKWFDSLSRDARDLFIYLLTNQDIGLSGCYYITDKKICYHTHLNDDELQEAKKQLNPKIMFTEDWVYVSNSQGYNGFTGKNNEIALKREIELIPKNIKNAFNIVISYTHANGDIYPINHNHNNKSEIIKKKAYKLIGNTMVEE
jgi:hypothetical protein